MIYSQTFRRRVSLLCIISVFTAACDEPVEPTPTVTERAVTFKEVSSVKDVVPYESVTFGGNAFPGAKADYKVFLNSVEAPIESITNDSMKLFIPLEVTIGENTMKLLYKGDEHKFGRINILDWRKLTPGNVTYIETGNSEYPLHILDSMNNSIMPHVTSEGVLDRIAIHGSDGFDYVLEMNEEGLPDILYSQYLTIIFDSYDLEKATANLVMYDNADFENVYYQYGIPVDIEKINSLIDIRQNGRMSVGGRIKDEAIGQALDVVGTVFNVTGCIVSAGVATVAFTPIGGFLAGLTCLSAGYSAYKILNPKGGSVIVDHLNAVHGIKMGLIDCLMLTTKPTNAKDIYDGVYGCYSLTLEAVKGINSLYDQYKLDEEVRQQMEKQRAIINTGFGDIKITLDWNTIADLDLWVTEPSGEKITFEHTLSATQGQLDLDDTDGFGPENIFWPQDKAPIGTTNYKIQVHFYGSADDPVTNYRVVVSNFGVSRTFTGSIAYNQVVTITEFKAGEWRSANGRMATTSTTIPIEVGYADRSVLKK